MYREQCASSHLLVYVFRFLCIRNYDFSANIIVIEDAVIIPALQDALSSCSQFSRVARLVKFCRFYQTRQISKQTTRKEGPGRRCMKITLRVEWVVPELLLFMTLKKRGVKMRNTDNYREG